VSVEVRQDDVRPRLPGPNAGLALLMSLAVALAITIGEIDHLLSQVLDDGRTWSVTTLTGVSAVLHPGDTLDGWQFFADRAQGANGQVDGWLRMYAATDLAFAATYALLGVVWFSRLRWSSKVSRIGVVLVVVGAAADCVENLLIGLGAPLGWLLLAATAVKWLALLPAVVLAVWSLRHTLARLPKALYTHRYSALIVLPLAVLSLGRGPDLLEQLPDIQRAWADPGHHGDFVWAGLVMVVLVIATLFIGRQRTGHLWLRTCPRWTGDEHPCGAGPDSPDQCPVQTRREHAHATRPLLRLWFIGPVLLVLSAAVLALAGADIGVIRLLAFCALPLAIGGLSLYLRHRWGSGAESRRPTRAAIGVRRFRTTAAVGDVLVGLLPVVAGLGVIRAFSGPIALSGATVWSGTLFVAGWITLLAAWPALAWAHRALEEWSRGLPDDFAADNVVDRLLVQLTPGVSMNRGEPPVDDPDADLGDRVRAFLRGFAAQRSAWTVLLVAGVTMVAVGLLPVLLAETVGVIATFQLALGSASVVVASSVILFQPGGSPEALWPLRIPFAPVTSLIVLAMLFAATVGGDDVHRIRPYAGPNADYAATDRPELDRVFTTWLRTGRSCAEPLPVQSPSGDTDLKVRPLLMYAAEGGGIRAAYWTTAAIDRLATPATSTGDPVQPVCRSALLSSGASGGSVGLSIASVREAGSAADAVTAIAGPEALGAASDGLILRDTIYAATGVPVPSLLDDRKGRAATWQDRGTLIEQAWEEGIDSFDQPFLRPRPALRWDWGPTGALVVNSTSPTTSCRTLISQVQLPGEGTSECSPGQPAAASTDLVQCTGQLRTVTAALLTARFPYVTPSGVVDCPGPDGILPSGDDVATQVVDGGYAENTGVGTLLDLMPRVLADVRHHNSCVLSADPRGGSCRGEPAADTLVVPQLVYFDNGTGSDLVHDPRGVTLEALVPPITILKSKGALYSARAQLERAHAMLATDQLWSSSTELGTTAGPAVDEWRGNQVAVVYQATRPGIAAPLGWMLSEGSIAAMDDALCEQDPVQDLEFGAARDLTAPLDDSPDVVEVDPPTRFGTIDDVLDLLPGGSGRCSGS
jgi:hypothetical protein